MYILTVYHYAYQAIIRSQIAVGSTKGKFTEWKASMALIVLDLWWTVIVASWIKIDFGYDLLFGRSRLPLLVVVALLMLIDRRCLSSKEVQAEFKKQFLEWPSRKRKIWDIAVAVFAVLTFGLMLYSLVKVRDLKIAEQP